MLRQQKARFDFHLWANLTATELKDFAHYDAAKSDSSFMESLVESYVWLLKQLCQDEDGRLPSEVPASKTLEDFSQDDNLATNNGTESDIPVSSRDLTVLRSSTTSSPDSIAGFPISPVLPIVMTVLDSQQRLATPHKTAASISVDLAC